MSTLLERVEAVLSTTPERWQRLVSTLPTDLLARQPAAGEWSALNCLQHLLNAELINFPVRFRAFLTGQPLPDFDPSWQHESVDPLTAEQLVAEFTRLRRESLALLKGISEDDLEKTSTHPRLGTVVILKQLLNTWAAHDLMHTVQAERALMQPFMLECGSWRVFFKDHEVKTPE